MNASLVTCPRTEASTMRPWGLSKTRPPSLTARRPGISGTSSVPGTNLSAAPAAGGGSTARQPNIRAARRRCMIPKLHLPLALGTVECRAVGLDDALDARGAAAVRAFLALLAVDRPMVLEISEFPRGLDIVA